ncbi:MAG: DMT family transporter [Thiohalocapsa sp.]
MSIPAAYLGVILIWSTTPLAIKWSSEGAGFLFGAASRMVLGVVACLLLIAILRRRMHWHRDALRTYLAAGLGIWGAMSCVYWASQFIPSGLIAVLFGLTPVVTGILAAIWLGERALTPARVIGLGLGLAGLAVIFARELGIGSGAALGITGILAAVSIHAASSVWVKRVGAGIPGLETTTGALLIAVPLFVANWLAFDGSWPASIDARTLWSIVYLALAGSTLGFILYYFVLTKLQASRVALIPLVTPVLALALGRTLNGELLDARTLLGAAVILTGLACWQWGDQGLSLLVRRRAASR